jgi:hypothetical protein
LGLRLGWSLQAGSRLEAELQQKNGFKIFQVNSQIIPQNKGRV